MDTGVTRESSPQVGPQLSREPETHVGSQCPHESETLAGSPVSAGAPPVCGFHVLPVRGIPEVRPGDDLAALLLQGLASSKIDLEDGDVLVVTQKVVSKAEGRIVILAQGKAGEAQHRQVVESEGVRVVARRGDLIITETRHGFVCANSGVDTSNVPGRAVTLLPVNPDASAHTLRDAIAKASGRSIGVIITDTFGRPWRLGLVDIAIGVAGVRALTDLRGQTDAHGRTLHATEVATADEIAAAAELAKGKSAGVPAVVVRGLAVAGEGSARDMVRPPEQDLFRHACDSQGLLGLLASRRSVRRFAARSVDPEDLVEAVAAACSAPAPHHSRPWRFVHVAGPEARERLGVAMRKAWRADLARDGLEEAEVERVIESGRLLLEEAPALIVPCVVMEEARAYPDSRRRRAEMEMFLLSGGAAVENLLLTLHAKGLGACWVSSTLFCRPQTRRALGLPREWLPLGAVIAGHPDDAHLPPPRPTIEISRHLLTR